MNEKKTTKRRGRPKLAKGEVKGRIVPVRLKEADLKLFSKAAKETDQTLSEWMRSTLREAATGRTA